MVGVVLAGGAGRRMGGAKATALLAGRPLLVWALDALREAGLERRAVVAKRDTVLPELDVPVWIEPDAPRHPLAGVAHALERAGEDIVTLPVDVPLVPVALLRELAATPGCAAVRGHPLIARFPAGTTIEPRGRVTEAVAALGAREVDPGPAPLLNINAPADLEAAEALVATARPGPGSRTCSS
jgi:molybdopterin-guanine dinucleotide biosynthesis protein A